MSERRVTIASTVGLHARPAKLFVEAAAGQSVRVTIAKGDRAVDAGSILSVLGLDARGGDEVVLAADGDGADEALAALVAVLEVDHDS
ncbi:Phosphotransferase system, phosphocarrier protein HPr [Alloactinosynnema sp. L-07]|uniref:HPr family phosphocarrier protein n=1 Tax=Alloactinosynnema sp. L-07 TaxID=1653480 RepID=UPI00065EF6BC|nr:HPr family phosphocarrier protein [Alloactinosynnema sp. L-07]CRK55586.1 Phosphotransferase system, phosphocarrier protein HPr [Alloactinosynnema sp. L-07]